MGAYHTEQKQMLLELLRSECEHAYTVEELVEMCHGRFGANAPGTSTVYRLMNHLVEEGTVKRFVKGHSRRFVYQIVGGEHCHSHLHLKCISCGRLLHLDDRISDELAALVHANSNFSVSEEETVLFGSCAACSPKKQEREGEHDA